MISGVNIVPILIYLLAYAITIVLGYFFVCIMLKRYPLPENGGFKGAGSKIGILERIFTLTFVLMGEYTAIGLIFTAKSITRFDELKNRKFSEYYLIGTLSSIIFAVITGIIVKWLLEVL